MLLNSDYGAIKKTLILHCFLLGIP